MISKKGKRKLIFEDKTYYWCIKRSQAGIPQIHISSDDKAVFLIRDFDREICIGPQYIKDILAAMDKETNRDEAGKNQGIKGNV